MGVLLIAFQIGASASMKKCLANVVGVAVELGWSRSEAQIDGNTSTLL